MAESNSASYAIPDELGVANEEESTDDLLGTVVVCSAVATLQEKINFAWMSIERTQPERKPYFTSAAWNAERSIRLYRVDSGRGQNRTLRGMASFECAIDGWS